MYKTHNLVHFVIWTLIFCLLAGCSATPESLSPQDEKTSGRGAPIIDGSRSFNLSALKNLVCEDTLVYVDGGTEEISYLFASKKSLAEVSAQLTKDLGFGPKKAGASSYWIMKGKRGRLWVSAFHAKADDTQINEVKMLENPTGVVKLLVTFSMPQ